MSETPPIHGHCDPRFEAVREPADPGLRVVGQDAGRHQPVGDDLDAAGDGVVGVDDLLQLLAVYGADC